MVAVQRFLELLLRSSLCFLPCLADLTLSSSLVFVALALDCICLSCCKQSGARRAKRSARRRGEERRVEWGREERQGGEERESGVGWGVRRRGEWGARRGEESGVRRGESRAERGEERAQWGARREGAYIMWQCESPHLALHFLFAGRRLSRRSIFFDLFQDQ
jgi:hypothetical protein